MIVDASVLYLIKYFTLFAAILDLLSFEIVIEDSEVFYLFLLAKESKIIRTLRVDKCECIEKLFCCNFSRGFAHWKTYVLLV